MTSIMTVISPVAGVGTQGNPFRPQFMDDFPAIQWSDVTARESADNPGDPELVIIDVITDDPSAIYNNTDYFVLSEDEYVNQIE